MGIPMNPNDIVPVLIYAKNNNTKLNYFYQYSNLNSINHFFLTKKIVLVV